MPACDLLQALQGRLRPTARLSLTTHDAMDILVTMHGTQCVSLTFRASAGRWLPHEQLPQSRRRVALSLLVCSGGQ